MVTDLLGICQNEKLDVLLCNRNSSMSLFLKNLSTSFFRAVVSSRPIFNKATSLFASIAINANKHPRLPINTIGTAHTRSICFGSPFERKSVIFSRKFILPSSRTYSKSAKKSPNDCDDASKNKPPDKTKKDSSKSPQYVCEDLRKSAAKAKAKTPDKTKKPSKGASNIKLSAKGIKCAVEKEGILCYIDCKQLVGDKGDSKDQPKVSKQSKSEGEVCKKPSKKDIKKSKTVGDVRVKETAKKPPAAPPKKKKKKRKLLPDDDADVKAMTGTWVSKKCLKFDFSCGGKVVKAGTEPFKLEDCDEEEPEAKTEDDCYMPSKAEGTPDQSPIKKCIQQCKKNFEHKNMSTKSGSYDDDCEEKPKRKSKKQKKKKKKKTPSKKKDEDCKPCSSKKGESKGKSKKKEEKKKKRKEEEEESKAFATIEQLTKELCECKRSLAKLKAEFEGTAGECQPAPKLDKKLPKPKKQDKDVINCSKSLLQSVCDGIKASKSAPSVSKSKSVKDVKKSKSSDCTQSKKDDEKPKKKVSDFCKGKEKDAAKDECSDKVSAAVKASQKPKPSPPCKYKDAKSVKKKSKDECKPAKAKDECEDEAEATKAKDDECEDEKQLARKKAKKERLQKLMCANENRRQAAKSKSKQQKDPEPEEYCTEPKKKKPEPKKEKPKIKTACEMEKSGKRTKRRMICTDDPDRNPKHEPKGKQCLEEFGKSQKKPKNICAKPKKSDDCKPKEKKSKSDICKSTAKKPSKSKSDTCKPTDKKSSKPDPCKSLEKKPSKSKSDTCKPSDKKSSKSKSSSKSDPCKPSDKKSSKSKSDPCKSDKKSSKSKSDPCKSLEKKPSKSKSDPCKSLEKKQSKSTTGKKASKPKSDPCKTPEKKPSKTKSDPCKTLEKKPSKSKCDTGKSSEKKKSKSDICTTAKTKPLCKPKIAEAGKKKTRFPEYCPSGTDEPKSSKSLPPDQSPIMQCIALCKKKMKANKPQEGKGVPPRDKKPCTTDKKVFKKLVEFTEETDKCKKPKPKEDEKDPCKKDKKAPKKAKSEETEKCEQFVPCKTEEIKPGIRGSKGEGDDKTKVECPPKKKKSKIPDCPPESKPKEKKEEKKVKKKEAKEAKEKEAKDEEVKVEQNEAKCIKFPFSCNKEEECQEEVEECQEEKEKCQEKKDECQEEKEEKKPVCECVENKDPCEDTNKKKKKQEDDCD